MLPTVCDFKSEVEELPMIDFLGLVGEMLKKILLENIRKILGSKCVQVKGLMPPKDGISRKTPTGRVVGRNVVWHNFFCCSKMCYAWGQFYRDCHVAEKSRMFHGGCRQ